VQAARRRAVGHELRKPSPTAQDLLNDRDALIARLAETYEPLEVVRLMYTIGLRYSDLALALDVHPRTVRSWLESEDRDPGRHRDGILTLKSVVLFLLRRGIVPPRQVALWLVEPNERLDFRRPLAVLSEDGGIHDVISASATFTRPEPRRKEIPVANDAVAAGATGRKASSAIKASSGIRVVSTQGDVGGANDVA
jgi:transposase-like protein